MPDLSAQIDRYEHLSSLLDRWDRASGRRDTVECSRCGGSLWIDRFGEYAEAEGCIDCARAEVAELAEVATCRECREVRRADGRCENCEEEAIAADAQDSALEGER